MAWFLMAKDQIFDMLEEEDIFELTDEELSDIEKYYTIICGVLCATFCIGFLTQVLLAVGAAKERTGLLMPYLIWTAIDILVRTAFAVVSIFVGNIIGGIAGALLTILLGGYFWICVYSPRKQIQNKEV